MWRIRFVLDGKEYLSKASSERTIRETKDSIYKRIHWFRRFEMETDNGYMLVGREAIQRGVLLVERCD